MDNIYLDLQVIILKYNISSDFKYIRFMTFPIVKAFAPIAEKVLGIFMKVEHSDEQVKVSKHTIDTANGKIDALFYEPKNCGTTVPAMIYYHGGGFIYKAAPYHYRLVKQYCVQTPCKVLMVDYRLTPKHSYPVPVNDCYSGLEWLVKNADELGIDKEKIMIAGDSAGGNLAAAVTLMARDNKLFRPCGQMLIYPVIDQRMKTLSMRKYTDTPVWNSRLSEKMWNLYLQGSDDKTIQYASPIEASNLSGLPETYIETAEFDCLHDEGIEYANALRTAGNRVILNETKNTIHGFEMASKSNIVNKSMKTRIRFLQNKFYNIDVLKDNAIK